VAATASGLSAIGDDLRGARAGAAPLVATASDSFDALRPRFFDENDHDPKAFVGTANSV
jgi:hypothetical protein